MGPIEPRSRDQRTYIREFREEIVTKIRSMLVITWKQSGDIQRPVLASILGYRKAGLEVP